MNIRFPKCIREPRLFDQTILTDDPVEYVELYLRRERQSDAIFYWRQAKEFLDVTSNLSLTSAPLPLYYSYLNAAKALLASKGIAFREHHGVGSATSKSRRKISLSNEMIKFWTTGVAAELCKYFGDPIPGNPISLKNCLSNIPYVQRTFCLTYRSFSSILVSLRNVEFEADTSTGFFHVRVLLEEDAAPKPFMARTLPSSLEVRGGVVRSVDSVSVSDPEKFTEPEISNMKALSEKLRKDLVYIKGHETLWYLMKDTRAKLSLNSTLLTFIAMHRLSEVSRYQPKQLSSFLEGGENWLISEFIRMSPIQFFDQISAEITGGYFMTPNVRKPR